MSPPGVPPKMEYDGGEMIPFLLDDQSKQLGLTRWRCMQCGNIIECVQGRDAMFGNCGKCGAGRRWGFVEARPMA